VERFRPEQDRIRQHFEGIQTLHFRCAFSKLGATSGGGNTGFQLKCQAGACGKGARTLDIETKTQDGVKVLKLKGRFCMGPPLDRFNAAMTELLKEGHNRIVLDLEEVPTMDSSGIGVLVRFLASAKQGGGAIRLLKPSKFVVQTLRMVGLLNLFTTFEDLEQAVSSFQ
jgi:anti-sigma B factor antagonist